VSRTTPLLGYAAASLGNLFLSFRMTSRPLEIEGSVFVRNVGNRLPSGVPLYPRRRQSFNFTLFNLLNVEAYGKVLINCE
jgi:hypothetical protein